MEWNRHASLVLAHRDNGDAILDRAVWISSEDDPYSSSALQVALRFNMFNKAPHFVYNPLTGDLIQMISLKKNARALKDAEGFVQIVTVSQDERPFTEFPCPNLSRVVDSLASLSVPLDWPLGPPSTYSVQGMHTLPGNYGAQQLSKEKGPGAIDIKRLTIA